jgi:hypothetical protein
MRLTKLLASGLMLVSLGCSGSAKADPLPASDDADLAKIINNMEIIAKQDRETTKSLPEAIPLVRVGSDGECDGTPESCPTETVYIAVSEYGEYPDRKRYQLPASHGWAFKEWLHLPKQEADDNYFKFTMTKQVVAAGWWSNEMYKVRVNLHDAASECTQP